MLNETDDFDSLYGSKYLGVADLKDREPRLKIGKVEVAELTDKSGVSKRKYVMWFEGATKALVINRTNAEETRRCLRQAAGELDWPGRRAVRRGHQLRQGCSCTPAAQAGTPRRT
jgi:hypothetical protein